MSGPQGLLNRNSMGYQVLTELEDGRIFAAYWFCAKVQKELIEEVQIVRHITGSFVRLD